MPGEISRRFWHCEKHLATFPDDHITYARRGIALLSAGREAEARKDFDTYLQRGGVRAIWEQLVTQTEEHRKAPAAQRPSVLDSLPDRSLYVEQPGNSRKA